MEVVFNGTKIKYENGELWKWYCRGSRYDLKNPYWRLIKQFNNGDGYKRVRIGKNYLVHRVIYYLHNQEWDIDDSRRDNSIDHIDGNRQNNSIENLRVVNQSQNGWNNYHRDVKGYYWDKSRKKFIARIRVNYKVIHLGYFDMESDAHNAYLDAKKKYHII